MLMLANVPSAYTACNDRPGCDGPQRRLQEEDINITSMAPALVASDANTTTSVTATSTFTTTERGTWGTHNFKQCYTSIIPGEIFNTLASAKSRCVDLAPQCWGVYDEGCDASKQGIFLCSSSMISSSSDLTSAVSSCVIELNPAPTTTVLPVTTTALPVNPCSNGWQQPPECTENFNYYGEWYTNECRVENGKGWCSHEVYFDDISGWSDCKPCHWEIHSCSSDADCIETCEEVDGADCPVVCDTHYWRCACRGRGRIGWPQALTSDGTCDPEVVASANGTCKPSHDVLINVSSLQSPEIRPEDFIAGTPSLSLIAIMQHAVGAALERAPQEVAVTDVRLIWLETFEVERYDPLIFCVALSLCAAGFDRGIDTKAFEHRFRNETQRYTAFHNSTTSLYVMRIAPRDPLRATPPWEALTADQVVAWGSAQPLNFAVAEDAADTNRSAAWGITVILVLGGLTVLIGAVVFVFLFWRFYERFLAERARLDALDLEKKEEEAEENAGTKLCRVRAFSPAEVLGDDAFSSRCLTLTEGATVEVIRGSAGWLYGYISGAPEHRGCFPESRVSAWITGQQPLALTDGLAYPGGGGIVCTPRVGAAQLPGGFLPLPAPPPLLALPGPSPPGFFPGSSVGFMAPSPPICPFPIGVPVQPPVYPPVQLTALSGGWAPANFQQMGQPMMCQPAGSWPTPRVGPTPAGPPPSGASPRNPNPKPMLALPPPPTPKPE